MTTALSSNPVTRTIRTVRVGPLTGGGFWGVLAVAVAYLAISIPQWGQPWVIDEAVFPYVADGILKNGAPVFYNGELRPTDIGLWHPPLYDYLLAGFVGIFGFSTFSVRAFGAVCVLLAVFFLTLAMRRIAPSMPQVGYVALSALVLLNPLVISGALVPDIDTSLGFLVVVLALWLATILKQEELTLKLGIWLAAFATLSIATKLVMSGFVAVILGVAALLSRTQRWRKVLALIGAFVVGTAVAMALMFLAGAIIGFDARLPFDYLFTSLGARTPGRSGLAGAFAAFATGPGSSLVWIGPAIFIAAIAAAILIGWRRPKGVDANLVIFMAAAGLVIVIGYAFISASPFLFPKYTPIAVPAFALAATTLLMLVPGRLLVGLRRPRALVIVISYFAILVIGTVGMFALAARNERIHRRTLEDLVLLSIAAFIAVVIVTAIAIVLLRSPKDGETRPAFTTALASAALIALVVTPVMAQTSTSLVNATVPYASRYYYGERGMQAFLKEAAALMPEDSSVIAAKDVGFQLPRAFYEDALLFAQPVDEFRDFIESEEVAFFVTRRIHDYSEPVYPEHYEVIKEFYTPILDDPDQDFVLWELKAD